jgi:pimeloyl-ACP methyl ester carboxylesterase
LFVVTLSSFQEFVMFQFAIFTLIFASAMSVVGQTPAPAAADTPPTPFLTEDAAGPLLERYDVLAVDKAQFLKTVVEIGQIATDPAYTEELLRVKWRQHDPIDVSIVRPFGIAKPPVVLFLYGYGTDPEKFLNRQFCATLASKGFAAVGFQTALIGPRYHDRPLKKWFVSELPESIGASVHDVQLMIDYLETRNDLDTHRIGIFGQGSGGAISILAAAADYRIKAIDVMNPWGDWPDWLAHSPVVPDEERADYISPAFLQKVHALDPTQWMDRLADRPFRLQETLFDPTVPEEVRKKIQEALPKNGQLALYVDQATYTNNVSHNGRMLDWMQDQLGISHSDRSESSLSKK